VARMGDWRGAYWVLVGSDQLEDPRRREEDNINVDSKSGVDKNGLNWSVSV